MLEAFVVPVYIRESMSNMKFTCFIIVKLQSFGKVKLCTCCTWFSPVFCLGKEQLATLPK